MNRLNPQKLHTFFSYGISKYSPIESRHYTITHSDATGDIFLDIGVKYNLKKINYAMRDEVLASWTKKNDNYTLNAYCFVGNHPYEVAKKRYEIFVENINIPLQAIRYGDRELFRAWPFLDESKIFVHFESTYSDFNKNEYYGTFKQYIL